MRKGGRAAKPIYIGYLPFGNYPYAIIEDSRLDALLSNRYERTLEILDRCPDAKMTLALTGQTKELVAREFPRTYHRILDAMKRSRLDLTQCPYSHPLPVLVPHSSLEEHISRDLEVTKKYYGVHPEVFWSPECAWSPYLPKVLRKFGATSIYLRQLPVKAPVWIKGIDGEKVIGFNLGSRPKWDTGTKAARIRKDFERIQKELVRSGKKYGFLLVFGDDIEISGIEEEALLHERIFNVAAELHYVKPVTMGEFLKKHEPEDEMVFDEVCCWINHFRWWAGDIVDIHQNSLAQRIRRNLGRAGELMKKAPSKERKPLESLMEKSMHDLVMIESTEPRAWRPSLDRRLWGYRHAGRGIAYSESLIEKCIGLIGPEDNDDILVPLVESRGLKRVLEPVETKLSFPEGRFFGDCRVEMDRRALPHQMSEIKLHDDGSLAECILHFEADSESGSVKFTNVGPLIGGSVVSPKTPSSRQIELVSDSLSVKIDLERGGRIVGMVEDGREIIEDGEYINALHFTPTKTFERLGDDGPAELTGYEDGPVMCQVRLEQRVYDGIEKLQTIRLYKNVPRVMIETQLVFSHPESLGVYQPWKQNKSDKSLIVGDICLKGDAAVATTLPCSPDVIQELKSSGEGPLKYIIIGNDWAAISPGTKTLGIIADGSVSKFDIARVRYESGCTYLGYDAGSPSQFGPHYNDERHGFWSRTHTFRLFYVPVGNGDYEEVQRQSLTINHPLHPTPAIE